MSTTDERLSAIEKILKEQDPVENQQNSLREYQISMLLKLRHLRETFEKEDQQSVGNEELRKENDELKEKVSKLEYRIKHLLQHIPPADTNLI